MQKIFSGNKSQFAVLAAFFTNGAVMATWVSRIPYIQAKLNLSEGGLGLVLLGLSMGILLGLSISGSLIARWGSAKMTLWAGILMLAMLPVIVLASNPIMLFVVLAVFGGAMSSMDVSMNEQAVLVERKMGKALMSSFHGCYSIGALIGSLISSAMAALPGVSTLLHFILAALLFGALVFCFYPALIPASQNHKQKKVVFRLPERVLWMLGIVAFCSAIGENAMADWSAVYMTDVLSTSAAFAALGYAAFSLTMTIGRFMGDQLKRVWEPALIVRVGSILAVVGFALLITTNHPILAIAGFAVIGLGLSNIIPIAYGAGGNVDGIETGAGIAGVATIGYTGSLFGPPMIGFIAEKASLRVAFFVIMLLAGTLIFTANSVKTHQSEE